MADPAIRTLQVLPHLIFGGTEFHVLRQLRSTDPSRCTHTVCYLGSRDDLKAEFVAAGIPTICLGHTGPATLPRTVSRLVRIIRERRIDVVHTHSRFDRLYGQTAAWISGVPVVNTMHSMYVAERYQATRESLKKGFRPVQSMRLWLEDRLERETVRHVIAVSEDVRRTWLSRAGSRPVAQGNVSVVYAGLDFDQFRCSPEDERIRRLGCELGLTGASPVLVNVARLESGKSQTMLVPVMRAVLERWPVAKALIVGAGPERENIEAAIRGAGLEERIVLAGARSDVSHCLALGDVFVFPSISEGFGNAVLEAVAAAKPVVAFDLPPLRKLLEPPIAALLVQNGDVEALTAATLQVLERLDEWRRRARTGSDFARGLYDARRWARELENVYAGVVHGRRTGEVAPAPGAPSGRRDD